MHNIYVIFLSQSNIASCWRVTIATPVTNSTNSSVLHVSCACATTPTDIGGRVAPLNTLQGLNIFYLSMPLYFTTFAIYAVK